MVGFNEKYYKRQFINRNRCYDTYKAISSVTNKEVGLKILVNNNKKYIYKIQKDVEIIKKVNNPNLININSMGSFVEGGTTYYYIESESFSGISLKNILKMEKISNRNAVKIAVQVAQGLKEFHSNGIVYGKLTSDNIYIDRNGIVKVDAVAYLKGIEQDGSLNQCFSIEEDLFYIGAMIYEIITGGKIFTIGTYKKEVQDKDLLSIISKYSNNKHRKCKDVYEFISNAEDYLEDTQGVEEEELLSYAFHEDMMIKGTYNDYNIIENNGVNYKGLSMKVLTRLCAYIAIILLMITIFNGWQLFGPK